MHTRGGMHSVQYGWEKRRPRYGARGVQSTRQQLRGHIVHPVRNQRVANTAGDRQRTNRGNTGRNNGRQRNGRGGTEGIAAHTRTIQRQNADQTEASEWDQEAAKPAEEDEDTAPDQCPQSNLKEEEK